MDIAELVIRERVRDTYAAYTHAGDRFRLEELADCFAADGVLEIKGSRTAVGRAAIVATLGGGRDRPAGAVPPQVRHFVTNLRFDAIAPDRVETSAYFCVITHHGEHLGVDHWGRYRDVLTPAEDRWVFAHRLVRVDAAMPAGWYAGR
ncbi:nuclear transport factor 2 family protein [Nocardioides sp. Iso805N]|uniref:nuclear transport factor 2 family protein n=1 Tax=Nocardioides sp. Iso805N TaxID=1283287 RepID=UPI000369A016|nr:nuclear transport factor 2 family protein [Nocardioides sp. Iso805N]